MRDLSIHRGLLVLAGSAALLLPATAGAQVREIVSKAVSVGRSEAALHVEFADGGELDVTFRDGAVLVDGESLGAYSASDELDAAWRALLGQAVALDDGPLAQALVGWSPPADLSEGAAPVARALDQALESALAPAPEAPAPDAPAPLDPSGQESLLEALLSSSAGLGVLEHAVRGLGTDVQVHVDEDVVIGEEEMVGGALMVLRGDLRVDGRVLGDVILVDGTLELGEEGRIMGEARLADARLVGDEDAVEGGVVDLVDEARDLETEIRSRVRTEIQSELRNELRRELRDELRSELRDVGRSGSGFSALFSPFRSVFRGIGGLLENLVGVFILALVGAGVVAFAGPNLENVAEAARQAPGRAAVVGLAGTFLLLPVWILGAIALCVSIVGIPALIAWVPLFPIAAIAAAVLGYLAVARNAGEWLADSGYPWTDWIRKTNPIHTIVGGLFGLMLAFMAANVIGIAPFLGFISGLLVFVGVVVTFLAIEIGFGAVLLTRAGRRREYWRRHMDDADAAWEAAMRVDVEEDVAGTGATAGGSASPGNAGPGAPRAETGGGRTTTDGEGGTEGPGSQGGSNA